MTRNELINLIALSADEALIIVRHFGDINNPIEAWTMCEGILDAAVRRKIGEQLKGSDRNPYTGKLEKP